MRVVTETRPCRYKRIRLKMTLGIIDKNIRVFVRVRPLVERELAERRREVIHADEATRSIITQEVGLQEALPFNNFDHVLSPHSGDQAILGEVCVKLALNSLREGYNSSILTYGQTGSGKTFTVEQLTNEVCHPQGHPIIYI